jgi:hypothetical protein
MPLNQEARCADFWIVCYFIFSLAFFLENPHSFLYKLSSGEGMRGLTGSGAVLFEHKSEAKFMNVQFR